LRTVRARQSLQERFVARARENGGPDDASGEMMGSEEGLPGRAGRGVSGAVVIVRALLAALALAPAAAAGCVGGDGDGGGEGARSAGDDSIGPRGRLAPKGMRLTEALRGSADAVVASPPRPVSYFYSGAYQYATADGMAASLTEPRPVVAPHDFHSLGELAAESINGLQIVEVGYTVDRAVNGDGNPHLFVYHWVNGLPTCYNGCGWVQVSTQRYPGMAVAGAGATAPQSYRIKHTAGAWWVGYQGEWIGYFPDALWTRKGATFTSAGLFQWFGEVAATTPMPCTDMGAALFSNTPSAARMSNLGLFIGSSTIPALVNRDLDTNATYYTGTIAGGSDMRYGGPGTGVCP